MATPSLEEQVNQDLKTAMMQKDQQSITGLRAIKSAIVLAKTEKGAKGQLDKQQELKLLQKLIKQRKDSLSIFQEQNRNDLARKEEEEIEVIERYLPKQISDDELQHVLEEIIKQVGATGMKDMGKVMGAASQQLSGQADGSRIAEKVKSLLGA